ncbi:unnamed protein product [Phytophthora fragariaefolia]|uniref:Unnamed protein product n=1 Tax=Phytophthora fragariaefolia TaxID=1490495 RepID=A0A9W7CQX1_9STRA|nr:unnamed protein product [Phytophthora fragariaefolia]
MTAELKRSPRGCRQCAARSIHDDDSSRRLFYVESNRTDADNCSTKQAQSTGFSNEEDESVRKLALSAMTQFRKRLNSSKLLVEGINGNSSESRTNGEFTIMSSGVVPCTAHEIVNVLSPDNTDRWNASMVEMFGHDFGYGVIVRSVAIPCNGQSSTHLSTKVVHFNGLIPLLSKKTTTLFLDYTEFLIDPNGFPEAWRVMQTLERDARGVLNASDVLAGYHLEENGEAQHTQLYFLASHSADKIREHTVQRLQKLSSTATKTGDLALRQRLGALPMVEPPPVSERSSITRSFASTSASASTSTSFPLPTGSPNGDSMNACASCDDSLTSVLKRKHFCRVCGQLVCCSCVSIHEAEYRIGLHHCTALFSKSTLKIKM